MSVIVQKYGGTSVANIELITNIANYIAKTYKHNKKMVVVVSAMAGETNRLVGLAKHISVNTKNREMDIIAATGEQVTISLLSLALQSINIPAKSYCGWQIPIITTDDHTEARIKEINIEKINSDLKNNIVVIVAGFQGVTVLGDITTLGRGGSDTSAVALAVALKASECQIYTDVNGVYNADPNKVTTAKRIELIDGQCMLEASSLGAKVLHVRSCELAYRYKTNIRVLSTFAPLDQGSLIMNQIALEDYPIISLTTQDSLTLVSCDYTQKQLTHIMEEVYKTCNIDMLQISKTNISFVIEETKTLTILDLLKQLNIHGLSAIQNLTKISVIGSGFRSNNTLNLKVWQLLGDIEIFSTTHNEISMSILVHNLDATLAKNKLTNLLN